MKGWNAISKKAENGWSQNFDFFSIGRWDLSPRGPHSQRQQANKIFKFSEAIFGDTFQFLVHFTSKQHDKLKVIIFEHMELDNKDINRKKLP